ncbi:ABC transporter permease [Cellulomonas hominis]|uniref:ABC transporter permease n=1 Tax=Cellulomonas hominis TaxID=156981 RepID=UPI0030B84813
MTSTLTPAAPARVTVRPPLGGWAARDTGAMVGRSLRRSLRTPDTLIMGIALPVILMLLFVYVFGGAIRTDQSYVDYVVPGIILLCAGYGAATTAVSVASDMTGGLMNRFRTLPVRPVAALTGHVVESVVRNAVSTALVVGVAYAAGFRPTAGPAEWLATAGLVLLYVLALTWTSVAIGIVSSGPEAANGFSFAIMFLPYVSSAFVPPESMPRVLEVFATYQPITPVTDTVRAWLTGVPGGQPLVALAWCAGLLVVARLVAACLFRRRAAR